MSTDIAIKVGDTRAWSYSLSDADGDALSLTGATVTFALKSGEWSTAKYMSDCLAVTAPTSDGAVTITPTASDWLEMSDAQGNYSCGIYIGEFLVIDANGVSQYTTDAQIEVQEAIL